MPTFIQPAFSNAIPSGGALGVQTRHNGSIICDKPGSKVARLGSKGGRTGGANVTNSQSTVFQDGKAASGQLRAKGAQGAYGQSNHTDPFDGARRSVQRTGMKRVVQESKPSAAPRNCFRATPKYDQSTRAKHFVCSTGAVHAGSKKCFNVKETLDVAQPFVDTSVHRRFASSPRANKAVMPMSPTVFSPTGDAANFPPNTARGPAALEAARIGEGWNGARMGKRIGAPKLSLEGVLRPQANNRTIRPASAKPFATSTPRPLSVSKAGSSYKGVAPPFNVIGAPRLPAPKIVSKRMIAA